MSGSGTCVLRPERHDTRAARRSGEARNGAAEAARWDAASTCSMSPPPACTSKTCKLLPRAQRVCRQGEHRHRDRTQSDVIKSADWPSIDLGPEGGAGGVRSSRSAHRSISPRWGEFHRLLPQGEILPRGHSLPCVASSFRVPRQSPRGLPSRPPCPIPSPGARRRARSPAAGVYRFRDATSACLYVGKAKPSEPD
jgi:hypothetical protein